MAMVVVVDVEVVLVMGGGDFRVMKKNGGKRKVSAWLIIFYRSINTDFLLFFHLFPF